MTKYESLKTKFEEEENKIKSECETARQKLEEMDFSELVSKEVFQKVFSRYWEYSIHEFRLMNVNEKNFALQFLIRFEDDETMFVYLEAK